MRWENELTTLLNIHYPIVQAPMLGVTTPAMVAAVSNLGGLGSLPVGGLSPAKTAELISATKALTNKPFAVNLFAHSIPEVEIKPAGKMIKLLQKISKENNFSFETPDVEKLEFHSYKEQIAILKHENITIVSSTFGIMDDESIKTLKDNFAVLIGTATCTEEALQLQEKGFDIITAQGFEAGGHRGSFLKEPLPQIGLFSLLPQLAKSIKVPILAAGGIHNGSTIKAALTLGAKGVQVGTAFIAADESAAAASYKAALKTAKDTDIVLTKAITGRWARGIKNELISAIESEGIEVPGYPIQNSLTQKLREVALKQDDKEFISLWAGQSATESEAKPVAEIFMKLVRQTETIIL